jgi:hypothetical protein
MVSTFYAKIIPVNGEKQRKCLWHVELTAGSSFSSPWQWVHQKDRNLGFVRRYTSCTYVHGLHHGVNFSGKFCRVCLCHRSQNQWKLSPTVQQADGSSWIVKFRTHTIYSGTWSLKTLVPWQALLEFDHKQDPAESVASKLEYNENSA